LLLVATNAAAGYDVATHAVSTIRSASFAVVVSVALTIAACGAPSSVTRVQGKLHVRGAETYSSGMVFDIPTNLNIDCATLARSGLYPSQRRLQLLFTPSELTQDAPLQQFAISITDYKGPGTYPLDASTFRFAFRSRILDSIGSGAALTVAPDGSGSIRATGRFEAGDEIHVEATFTCVDARP
jgi:hypothetical protein